MSQLIPEQGALTSGLLADVRTLIEEARRQTTVAVNMGLTLMYWRIGQRIRQDVLKGERAEYGKEILSTLSTELEPVYEKGFAEKNLRRMVQFTQAYSDESIVVTLLRQLSWGHFIALIPLDLTGTHCVHIICRNTPAMPLNDAHSGGFFTSGACR